ncbi:MAG: MotA/TolQ/ExbB proton channel family protein [Victivallales bacterium]|nr:MotA/TolQ/ExbB proton channel family protein [Victivallales bacterium]
MDIGTIIGIILGIVLVTFPIISGGAAGAFIDVGSMMITMGGTLAALLISFPLPKVKSVLVVTKKTLNSGSLEIVPWYSTLIDLATIARRDGILALEERLDGISDDFLKRGLQMIVDGSPADAVNQIMEMEIENMEMRHAIGHSIWKGMGSFAPAFGMIGTLIGLVNMLQNLSDPSKLGGGMAIALITTFYGALFANLFCIPLQNKLEQRTQEEVHLKRMLLAGILSVQSGDSPRMVGEKLEVYLTPAERAANLQKGE